MTGSADKATSPVVGLGFAVLGPVVVALALVPVRSELDNANLALVLVFVVVVAAIVGGRRAGALAAVVATVAFDFFLTRPFLSLKVESSDDLGTVLILLGVGLLVGTVASRGRRAERDRARAARAIERVHGVADLVARGATARDVLDGVLRELRELLSLQDCWLEFQPWMYVMPRVTRSGGLDAVERRWFSGGLVLSEDGVELPVLDRGVEVARIVLIGDPGVAVTLEERVVAVALADQLGAAFAIAGPSERARLAKESGED